MSSHAAALLGHLRRLTCPPPDDAELLRRWVERRDEDAFTALVTRHGRMVHGVCRRILGNAHDAEDAFQAVFLILARKAASLRSPEALAGWLHGVAVRLACKARRAASRRPSGDSASSAAEPRDPHPDPLDALSARELLTLIDREIARLPEVYQLPLVLCDLEERTLAEAARLLGWTLGSLRGRLLRGRARLRMRLLRRGISPAALAAVFVQSMAETNAAPLAASVSRLAARFAVCPASAEVPSAVAALVRVGTRSLMLAKVKIVSAVLLAASTLAAGAGLLAWPTPALSPTQERGESKPPSEKPSAKSQVRRDQTGDPLPADALSRLGTTRLRHGGIIECLAFGPGGKTLVSRGWDGVRFWDAASGKEIKRFAEQKHAQNIALSPDGSMLAIRVQTKQQRDEPIEIRDFTTGRLLRRFGKKEDPALLFPRFPPDLLFSPNGKILVAYRWNHEIEVWNPATGRHLHTLKGHEDNVWSVAFSADSKTLLSSSDDKTIRFWDVATGKELRRLTHDNRIGKIALSPDGKLLAFIDTIKHASQNGAMWLSDHRVRLWDVATGKELRQLTMPAKELPSKLTVGFGSLTFSPDGKKILTGGMDGMLRVWEAATGKEVRQIPGFVGSPRQFVFAPDGKTLAVVDGSTTIRILDFASGKDVVPTLGHRGGISSISPMPDGQTIATTSYDHRIRFWEPATGREVRRRVVAADHSQLQADGRTYLTGGADRLNRVHDLATGEELAVLRGHEARFSFGLSPDRKTLASMNAEKMVRLLDPATGAVRHTLTKVKNPVSGMSFTSDGRTLAIWADDRTITIWDVATGTKRRQFLGPADEVQEPGGSPLPYTAALSPDGKLLAFGLQNNRPQPGILPVFDTATGKEVRRFTTAADGVSQLAFSLDGKSLAWGGWSEGTVYLGEIATGRERRHFAGHIGRLYSLVFSVDGKLLISGSEDTTALIWDLTGQLTRGKIFVKPLSSTDLETHWKALAAADAAAGYRAVQMLAADPERSVPYLRARLHPVAIADEKRLKQWIDDLDSEQFTVREKAASELEKLGESALHAMRKTLDERPALETRRRLEQLIEKQEREEWSPSPEHLRIRRALEVLERAGTTEAKDVLTILASGAPGAWLTRDAKAALARLRQRPTGKR
ncbi:MAG TPA: sigma-70 family RNA polymerase sigma factor [Gemmataceae bacterium]|jgi:RNA polymerase sigma factor (sigma-70 family)